MKLDKSTKSSKLVNKIKSLEIKELSYGWLGNMADFALVALFTAGALHQTAYTHVDTDKIISEAVKWFTHLRGKRLQKSLRCGLYQLAKKGYQDDWKVTNEGYRRLKELVPKYDAERHWDNSLYLVIFDISENLKRVRETLRKILQNIHFGMLQKSVWVGLIDPQPFLKNIINWNELEDFVLISKIGQDGYLSQEKIGNILYRAFKLELLNFRYKSFLEDTENQNQLATDLALRYLGLLKTDPQLPFELLPDDWLGDKAFKVYKNKVIPQLPHVSEEFIDALLIL